MLLLAVGALIGFGLSRAAAKLDQDIAKENREDLQRFQYEYTRDRWQLNREGLEAAGYNPLLALGISPNAGGPVVGTSGSSAQSADPAGEFAKVNSAKLLTEQTKTQEEITERTNADTDVRKSEAVAARAMAQLWKDDPKGTAVLIHGSQIGKTISAARELLPDLKGRIDKITAPQKRIERNRPDSGRPVKSKHRLPRSTLDRLR